MGSLEAGNARGKALENNWRIGAVGVEGVSRQDYGRGEVWFECDEAVACPGAERVAD